MAEVELKSYILCFFFCQQEEIYLNKAIGLSQPIFKERHIQNKKKEKINATLWHLSLQKPTETNIFISDYLQPQNNTSPPIQKTKPMVQEPISRYKIH